MSQFKTGEKVWVEAIYDRDYNEARSTIAIKDAHTCYPVGNGFVMVVPLSSILRATTEELERLRAYVELQLCLCQLVLVKLCGRCQALGKEKS